MCTQEMVDAPPWFLVLMTIGGLYVTTASLRQLANLMACIMRGPKDLRGVYGAWAVITGPTSGMGRSVALELARRGLNLVLVGRDPAKLQDVSDAIAAGVRNGVRTKTVVFDLSLASTAQGDEAIRRLRETVQGLDIGVLVNNAGVAEPSCLYLHEADVEALVQMIRVNLSALTQVTAAVLPVMLEKGRGAIVNIGSGSMALPSYPLNSVYAATKRYVTNFSKSLHVEYRSKGIDVQCQVPLFVDTKMLASAVEGGYHPLVLVTPDGFARAAVRCIGHGPLCIPHVAHRIQGWLVSLLPEFLVNFYWLRQVLQLRQSMLRLQRIGGDTKSRSPEKTDLPAKTIKPVLAQ